MGAPLWLKLARKEVGTKEIPGPRSNPTVERYYLEAAGIRFTDDVAWCGAFVGSMLRRAGAKLPPKPLVARSYLELKEIDKPILGAIGVWPRGAGWQGHVGMVDRVLKDYVWLISGNQNNAVTRTVYPRKTALGWRWPE